MTNELLPVSWSKISSYKTCPKQYQAFRVLKSVVETPHAATIWGSEVHEALEYAANENVPLPDRFKQYQKILDKVNALSGDHYIELALAVTLDLVPTAFESGDGWVRCIIDRLVVYGDKAINIDWKTGKKKPFSRQLDLSALVVFSWFPQVNSVHAIYYWTQTESSVGKTFHRSDIPAIQAAFISDISDMQYSYDNNAWPARPSGLCRPSKTGTYAGCPVLDCVHNGRYKK